MRSRSTRRKRLTAVIGTVTGLVLVMAACGSSNDSYNAGSAAGSSAEKPYSLVNPGTLTVAVYGSNAPYLTVEKDGTLGGVDGELLEGFAKSEDLTLTPFETTFASSILAVQQKKADIGTYLFHTPERAKTLYYTLPFLGDTVVMFTSDSFNWSGPDSMEARTVGTVTGFVWVPYLQKAFGSRLKLYPDNASAATALLNGQIDGVVNGASLAVIPPLQGKTGIAAHPLAAGDYGFPADTIMTTSYNVVGCDNKPLAEAYGKFVQQYSTSGQFTKITDEAVQAAVGLSGVELPNLIPQLALPPQGC